MSEFAEGGYVDKDFSVILSQGCEYLIPVEFARKWGESFLKKINEELDSTEPDVLD